MPDTMTQTDVWSPAPILEAVERYRGTIVDLDASRTFKPDEFARAREALAIALRRAGLGSGDRVVMALANSPLFIAALSAILACEGSPLLVHAKTPAAELRRYAQRFGARFLACEPNAQLDLASITSTCCQIEFSDPMVLCWGAFDDPHDAITGPVLRGVPLHPSSGSTGSPKIALRPGHAALEEARHYAATMAIGEDDAILAMPPMSHAYGYGMCVMVPLLTGADVVTTRRFSIQLIRRALAEHGVTIVPTVPAMLDELSLGGGTDLRQVRCVLVAGAVLPRRTATLFRSKTGVTAIPLYGTTETGGISVGTCASGSNVDGRVGPPMDGVDIDVRRSQETEALGSDTGKLFVRSRSLFAGYLDDQGQITSPARDGWFETGDLAGIDDDGTIHLRGRDSEVINMSGLKVVPCEVEEVIAQLPGVLEVKVYGGQHRWGMQVVKAVVATQGDLSEAHVRAHCERQLVYYKRPQMIALVDALPRTPTGKIDRQRLP